jgi:demethylmenaquinone methyltransferase/2-methoxy-6-polyprenyl-1,4-benzoquinol methylase
MASETLPMPATDTKLPLDKKSSSIRAMFADIAHSYDRLNHLLSLNVDRYWRWRTTRLVPPDLSGPHLDVCTGTGDLALAYHRASGGKLEVVATDFCAPMLVRGHAKAAGKIPFLVADTMRLPFPDATFRAVSVAFGLRNVSDTLAGLREMARVCAPGGTVAVLEFSTPGLWPLRPLYLWYFRNILPVIGRWVSRSSDFAYSYLPASVAAFPEREALAAIFAEAGIPGATWRSLTFGIATLYWGRKPAGIP